MENPSFDETTNLLADPERISDNLAMDASPGTFKKHSKQFLGRELTAEEGNHFRTMLCTTQGLSRYFGQAILHRSTCDLHAPDGRLLTEHLLEQGVLPIVKACGLDKTTGLIPAEDMQSLPEKMEDCRTLGFHLMKVRNTVTCLTGDAHAEEAAEQIAAVHRMAAENGEISMFLEPEFVRDHPGTLADHATLMTRVLRHMYQQILKDGTADHPWYLKTSYPAHGTQCQDETEYQPFETAKAYQPVLEDAELPEDLLIVQLSGGHSSVDARLLQRAINAQQRYSSWEFRKRNILTSYSRANLERPCQKMFPKEAAEPDVATGQEEILRQGDLNRHAEKGTYEPRFEDMTREEIWRVVNPD